MSGKYNGVKSKIIVNYPQALFSPCSVHSLNLCGVHAIEISQELKMFFGNIQKLYNFFSCSPSRWKIFQETAGLSLHTNIQYQLLDAVPELILFVHYLKIIPVF